MASLDGYRQVDWNPSADDFMCMESCVDEDVQELASILHGSGDFKNAHPEDRLSYYGVANMAIDWMKSRNEGKS